MNSPLTWAAVAILAVIILCVNHPARWRSILADTALWILTILTACAPLIIRSLT